MFKRQQRKKNRNLELKNKKLRFLNDLSLPLHHQLLKQLILSILILSENRMNKTKNECLKCTQLITLNLLNLRLQKSKSDESKFKQILCLSPLEKWTFLKSHSSKTNEAQLINQLLKRCQKNDLSQFNLIENVERTRTFFIKLTSLNLNVNSKKMMSQSLG